MNLAIIVTPENPVPPEGYGGGERVADVMVRQLVNRGHTVDLYAHAESTSPATNLFPAPHTKMSAEKDLLEMLKERADGYDCILDRAAQHLAAREFDHAVGIMAGDPYRRYPHHEVKNRVYVSREFAWFCGCPNHPVLRNPVCNDPWSLPLGRGEGGYCLHLGQISAMKGLDTAVAACRKLEMELAVFGPIQDKEFFKWISERGMKHYGVLGRANRDKVFGQAAVYLHPAKVVDADPGAPKEAMLHGTPCVCTPEGGIRSRVIPGATGFWAYSVEEYTRMIKLAKMLDRKRVRETMLKMCDPNVFGRDLEFLAKRIEKGDRW